MSVESRRLGRRVPHRQSLPTARPRERVAGARVYEPQRRLNHGVRSLAQLWQLSLYFGFGYVRKLYGGTYLGWLWVPLVPILDLSIRALVFGGFLGVSAGERPYGLYLVIGMGAWQFFERDAFWGYRSLQFHRRHIDRIRIPWLPAILGAAIPGAVQACIYWAIAFLVALYYKITRGSFFVVIDFGLAYTLLGLFVLMLYGWAIGMLVAPLIRLVRDVRRIVRSLFTFVLFLTPVMYPLEAIPEAYRPFAVYNPLTMPIMLAQHGLLGVPLPPRESVVVSLVTLAIALPLGLLYLLSSQRTAQGRL